MSDIIKLNEEPTTSSARLDIIFEASLDGIVIIDDRGHILAFNHSAERMFGCTQSGVLDQNVSILMPSPYREHHDEYIRRYVETGERHIIGLSRELVAIRKDGTAFPVFLSIAEIPGERQLFAGIVRDLSEIRQARDALRRSERLSAIGQAMTALVHEARNALARGEAALRMIARRTEDRPELREYIDRAVRAQSDIQQLFEEVREYAVPLKLKPQPIEVRVLVQQAWEQLALVREGRTAHLRESTCDNTMCCVDEFAMQRVFRNILENSLQSCEDPVVIDVEYSEVGLPGSVGLRIAIRDNGPGIPQADIPHLFEAFFTTRTRGTGLGLAIVKKIIESHGGQVTLQQSNGTGAKFLIDLPKDQA